MPECLFSSSSLSLSVSFALLCASSPPLEVALCELEARPVAESRGEGRKREAQKCYSILARGKKNRPDRRSQRERRRAIAPSSLSFSFFLSFSLSLSLNPDQHNRGKHRILDAPSPTHISLSLFPHHKNPEKN